MKEFSYLIIDDSETDRYLLKRHLSKIYPEAYAFEASDGQEGLDFFKNYQNKKKEFLDKFPPTLIFLDVNMPLMDGFQFLKEFKSLREDSPEYAGCIFMMFSSSERESDKQKAMSYQFVKDYLVKGAIAPDVLQSKISGLEKPMHIFKS